MNKDAQWAPKQRWYVWEGRNEKGLRVKGHLQAMDKTSVRLQLLARKIRPVRIGIARWRLFWLTRIQHTDVMILTRQLSTLLKAGLPLLRGLQIVCGTLENQRLVQVMQKVCNRIEMGNSLQSALQEHDCFSPIYLGMVGSGETSGQLDSTLYELANHLESSHALKQTLRSAMTYPLAVLSLSVVVMAVLLTHVVPAFASIFQSMNAPLPWPTQVVLGLSQWWVSVGWMWCLAVLLALLFAVSQLSRLSNWPLWRDQLLLSLPVWGTLLHQSCLARWSQTMASLIGSGLPMTMALETTAMAVGNRVYQAHTLRALRGLVQGTPLAQALDSEQEASRLPSRYSGHPFPPLLIHMVAVGEESGQLDQLLSKLAAIYAEQVNHEHKRLASLIEPAVVVALGVLVGGVVLAMYLPIFQLGQVL